MARRARFDMAMLEAIGVARVRTTTAWTTGRQEFEGVPLKALLERVGAFGDRIEAVALNDYKVEIPVSDFARWPVILAWRQNGELMRVRDKGPLWIVYPQDDFPALANKEMQGRWAWQLKEIRVR
ncbi:MAG: molybdopterin-dependent oxidoreductase [Alphaproteobacteria bacterium]